MGILHVSWIVAHILIERLPSCALALVFKNSCVTFQCCFPLFWPSFVAVLMKNSVMMQII